ncbi:MULTISPECIES: IclR family transcriptional regulator domain-containing protein [unclassified Haematobacter]|uniref:IclR family transcriptional regulator domain-containing protein n=1 Tax=unclassified Haematobacter TaxID=2640585 RepID=UPI0025C1CDCD|nr:MULTISPECIES: IclR family transcriptional regulator C-terminal domain-containing protein [unclassified Haematobacter]
MARIAKASTSRKPANAAGKIKPADFVSALARGIEVLRLFSEHQPQVTTSEVAERTGLSRAAARRFLLTLTELGYLSNQQESFSPLPKMLELGYSYLSTWNFREIVQPYLEEVVQELSENCSFAVLDGSDVVYLSRAEARRIVQSVTISVGTRVPAAVSALGRVLLAHLPPAELNRILNPELLKPVTPRTITDPVLFAERLATVRDQGYALVEGEFEEGLISVAVPVFDAEGRAVAAINVGTPMTRANAEQVKSQFLPAIQRAAENISRAFVTRSRNVDHELVVRRGFSEG